MIINRYYYLLVGIQNLQGDFMSTLQSCLLNNHEILFLSLFLQNQKGKIAKTLGKNKEITTLIHLGI
ncbi:hypothetical protein HMPREF9071_1597 [Capnocytophaga sp. oral taxon 338 str. F0234]|nr:hypothetical protein HMPREF9071_1597 [Capnocytophaga sp. oral taxon 338 str. F0234]